MTKQEMFDKIVAHLRKQGGKAVEYEKCAYRTSDGKMCAVGCLITDGVYKTEIEGSSMANSLVLQLVEESLGHELSPGHVHVLADMQYIHDRTSFAEWEMEFRTAALRNHLEFTPKN